MKFADYNTGKRRFTYTVPEEYKGVYYSLKELFERDGENTKYKIRGFYISNSSEYGKAPVVVLTKGFVNIPKHKTEVFEEMLKDSEIIDLVNEGQAYFKIVTYTYKRNGKNNTGYTVDFIDGYDAD